MKETEKKQEKMQIRLTQEDVVRSQIELINMINTKITGTPYLVSPEEKTEFFRLISYGLLSQSSVTSIKPSIKIKNITLLLARSPHHFAMKLMNIDTNTVIIAGYKIKTIELWKILRDCFERLYGNAQAEAISKSKEMPKGEESKKEFEFSSNE